MEPMQPEQPKPRILSGIAVTTPDGADLVTDVYLPAAAGPRPAIVSRTPYGRTVPLLMHMALRLAGAGFAVVLQDCRGRYRSQGAYDLLMETRDSHHTLGWLTEQEWCDGRAGLLGISVSSLPNLMVACEPQDGEARIEALVDVMGAVDYHRMCYRQGALLQHWALPWTAMMEERADSKRTAALDWNEVFARRPLVEAARRLGARDNLWRKVVSHPTPNDIWEQLTVVPSLPELESPILLLSGWEDYMLDQSLLAYGAITSNGHAREGRQKLIIGPWNHSTLFHNTGAARRQGLHGEAVFDLDELLVWWYRRWLDGSADHPLEHRPDVLMRLMGSDAWLASPAFPPVESEEQGWYLGSAGHANGAGGDGRLGLEPADEPGMDVFDYDPAAPVPTLGGAVWPFPPAGLKPGPADQRPIELRRDVLVFTGPPLPRDLPVVGTIWLDLWAASSAQDTDFTAKLVDVEPGGAARWVQDGIQRARFRESRHHERLLEPQRPYRFEIPLGAVAHLFKRGHRLRLEVASSNFPKYDNHLNTAEPLHSATSGMVARQTVFHGGQMPSRLRLPVLPDAALEALRLEL